MARRGDDGSSEGGELRRWLAASHFDGVRTDDDLIGGCGANEPVAIDTLLLPRLRFN